MTLTRIRKIKVIKEGKIINHKGIKIRLIRFPMRKISDRMQWNNRFELLRESNSGCRILYSAKSYYLRVKAK